MASKDKDSDKSEQGRLVSEALEFTQPQSQEEFTQEPTGSGASASHNDVKAGQLLGGKYKVIEVLGRGTAGVTYKVSTVFTCCTMVPRWPPLFVPSVFV